MIGPSSDTQSIENDDQLSKARRRLWPTHVPPPDVCVGFLRAQLGLGLPLPRERCSARASFAAGKPPDATFGVYFWIDAFRLSFSSTIQLWGCPCAMSPRPAQASNRSIVDRCKTQHAGGLGCEPLGVGGRAGVSCRATTRGQEARPNRKTEGIVTNLTQTIHTTNEEWTTGRPRPPRRVSHRHLIQAIVQEALVSRLF